MPTVNNSSSISGAGVSISRSVPRTKDGVGGREVTLPVGQPGTLTTRTDNDTGTITMDSGSHGIGTAQVVDIHWSGGVQYGVTVGTVAGTSVPFGAVAPLGGDNLPSASTAVVVTPRVQVNADIDGDALGILGIEAGYTNQASTAKSHVDFQDSGDSEIAELDLQGNVPQVFDVDGGSNNPFTGNPITKAFASNGSSTEVGTLKMVWAADSTP